MSSRIFVIQESPAVNITPALDYGSELIMMMPPGTHSFNPTRVRAEMAYVLTSNNFTEDDYLLMIGDPVLIGIACIEASSHISEGDSLKMLKWDRQDRRYLPIEVHI